MPAPNKTPATISVDFSKVGEGGGGRSDKVPEGDYLARIVGCVLKQKKDDPSRRYLRWQFLTIDGAAKNKTIYNNTSLAEESLWALRNFLIDVLGEAKVPKKALDLPIAKIVAAKPQVGLSIIDGEYNNKSTSEVSGTFSKADWESMKTGADVEDSVAADDDETEEAETPAKAATAADAEDMDEIDLDDL